MVSAGAIRFAAGIIGNYNIVLLFLSNNNSLYFYEFANISILSHLFTL